MGGKDIALLRDPMIAAVTFISAPEKSRTR
jgi:hypothetical protein